MYDERYRAAEDAKREMYAMAFNFAADGMAAQALAALRSPSMGEI